MALRRERSARVERLVKEPVEVRERVERLGEESESHGDQVVRKRERKGSGEEGTESDTNVNANCPLAISLGWIKVFILPQQSLTAREAVSSRTERIHRGCSPVRPR